MNEASHMLSVSCDVAAPRAIVWKVWTDLKQEWFAPKPWRAEVIAEDLWAGGRSALCMFGPDGEESGPLEGVFLEVVPEEKVISTDAFSVDWIPKPPFMTTIWTFVEVGDVVRVTATVRHWDGDALKQHQEMGFHPGWDIMLEQFKATCETSAASA